MWYSLEHWDVNNENLHGQWFQNQLNDRDYDLELFRMMYQVDPQPKLFLNEYDVVSTGATTPVSGFDPPTPHPPPPAPLPPLILNDTQSFYSDINPSNDEN